MIDYTKTTPWQIVSVAGDRYTTVEDQQGNFVASFVHRKDAERACLLAAAAEVQERRKWKAQRSPGGWFPLDCATGEWPHGLLSFPGTPTKEPAEVLVAADLWMKQQEKGA